ncbi:MAG: hypothetical protein NUV98_01425 [Candidatus Roizmanbacteria bacterium]|nr:hypothetical protein [Candidatus Roizmanbacteria bacterium]
MDHDHYPYTDAPQHVDPKEQLSLHKNHSKLLVPLILLIVGMLIVGGLSFAYLKGGDRQCDYQGVTYNVGDPVPSADGCNSCSCTYDELSKTGQVVCTAMACEEGDASRLLDEEETTEYARTSSLQLNVVGAEIMLINDGRYVGYDQETKQIFEEIPNSFYINSEIVPPGAEPTGIMRRSLFLSEDADGTYTLQVINADTSNDPADFTISLVGFSSTFEILETEISGQLSSQEVKEYSIEYDADLDLLVVR